MLVHECPNHLNSNVTTIFKNDRTAFFRRLSELTQAYEDVSVIYRKFERLVSKWARNKQM